ncbi:hypothetical protein Golob_027987, partial [Gossypium lobatum]|nr:hypothetical protein [Gossypium lobatum]
MAASSTDGLLDSRFFSTKKIGVLLDDNTYLLWKQQQDSALASWLLSFISQAVLPHLIGMDTSAKIWNVVVTLCGEVISEHEHVTAILNGLPPEYESVISIVTASQVPYSVQGVVSMLLDAETRQQVVSSNISSSTNLVSHQPSESVNSNDSIPAYQPSNTTRGRGRG